MLPDSKVKCPATGFARTCREIIAECECPKFVRIDFVNPQNGEKVDKYGCVDSFLPLLLLENAQMTRQAGAAINGFRNEVLKANETAVQERNEVLDRLTKGVTPYRIAG